MMTTLLSWDFQDPSETFEHDGVFVKRTNKVQSENFAILLVQKHIRARWCLPVDRGDVSQERDSSRLRNRVRHDMSGTREPRSRKPVVRGLHIALEVFILVHAPRLPLVQSRELGVNGAQN